LYPGVVSHTSSKNSDSPASRRKPHGSQWALINLLVLLLVAILYFKAHLPGGIVHHPVNQNAHSPRAAEAIDKVWLTIDFGGDPKSMSNSVPWQRGMTVRSLLASASLAGFGEKGRGASAFLVSIDGVENEGSGGRNWLYSVNGKRGDRSFAIYDLQPSDDVLWSFAPPE
jgi:Domain of unknown function (DUF4430)